MPDLCDTCAKRPIRYNKLRACHTCYMRDNYAKRTKAAHGTARPTGRREWFDWVVVNRAWLRWTGAAADKPGRHLTSAEKFHLLYHAMAQGETCARDLRDLIHGEYDATKRLMAQLETGAVTVYERDELGRPGRAMPPL